MASSKQLAGLVGPTIVAMIVSEFPLVQPHLYDTQIPAGRLPIGRSDVSRRPGDRARPQSLGLELDGTRHVGWVVFGPLGLFRMFAASAYQQGAASTPTPVFMVLEGILLLCGIVLTFKAYTAANRKKVAKEPIEPTFLPAAEPGYSRAC